LSSKSLARIDEITGTATVDGKIVYIEKHKVEYADDGKLLRAETSYESSDGKPIAHLKSDFTTSLTVPDHIIEDYRSGDVEGLRHVNGKITLFDKEKDMPEKTRTLDDKDSEDRILVGCQGLNYYVLGHLDSAEPIKSLPLRFLIPGKLDYYDFDMKEVDQPDKNIAEFEVFIKNWFLRIFAPKLEVKYDRKTKRLIWYKGLSNIKNDKGKNQSVTIVYKYRDQEVPAAK
jgi:hypothetical protein